MKNLLITLLLFISAISFSQSRMTMTFDSVNNIHPVFHYEYDVLTVDTLSLGFPDSTNVTIYVDDDDKVQTFINALRNVGIIVRPVEYNYDKKYTKWEIIRIYWNASKRN